MATYHIAEADAGAHDGSTPSNAMSVARHNSSTFSGDDVIVINGTIASVIVVPSGGTSGHPITYIFASGAKCSAPIWSNSTGAIYINQKDYITIDGGAIGTIGFYGATGLVNGIIENTANGTGLAHSSPSRGIQGINANHLIVKNLKVQNIYVRTLGADTNDDDSSCISNKCAAGEVIAGYAVTNCIVNHAYRGIEGDYGTGCSDYSFSYITAHSCNWGIGIGDRSAGKTLTGFVAHHVWSYDWTNWTKPNDPSTPYHHNGIFVFTNNLTSTVTTPTIYSCRFGPGWGGADQTSGIYMNGGILTPLIFNNTFVCDPGEYAGNGMIVLSSTSATSFGIYHNTHIGGGAGEFIHLSGSGNGSSQTIVVKNNLGNGGGAGTFIALYQNANVTLVSDYNLAYNYSDTFGYSYSSNGSGNFKTLAEWQALTFDAHSVFTNPLLTADYHLAAGSPARAAGLALPDVPTDAEGYPHPAAASLGVYEFIPAQTPGQVGTYELLLS